MSRPKGSGRGRGSDRRRGRAGRGQSTPSVDDNSVNGQVAPVPAPDQVLKTAGSKKEAPVAPSMPGSQPSGLVQVQVNLRKRKSSATEKSKEDVLEVQEGPRSKVLRTVTNGGDQVASAEVSAVGSASTGREKSAPESKKRKRGPTEEEEEPVAKGSKSTINGRSHGKGAARTSVHSLALSLTVQDYRGFAPPTKPTGLKGALLHGSPKELTLAQIRARQAELGAFFRETGAAMVGRNKKRGDEALKALEAAPMKEVQSKNWYQKILQQLATNETKQMGRMERVREMEQKSIDTELTGMVEQQMMQCERYLVERMDHCIQDFLRSGAPMQDLLATGHVALLMRVLKMTGLDSIQEVSRSDLIAAFEVKEGRDRSCFEFPQIRNRTNGGLYDRKFLPTAGTILREAVWEAYSELEQNDSPNPPGPSEMLHRLSQRKESLPDKVKGAMSPLRERPLTTHDRHQRGYVLVEEYEKQKASFLEATTPPRKKRKGTRRPATKFRKVQYVAVEVDSGDTGPDESYDPEMWGTYMVGVGGAHHPEDLVHDYQMDHTNPGQFRIGAKTTLEHHALEGLLALGAHARRMIAESVLPPRNAEDTEEEQPVPSFQYSDEPPSLHDTESMCDGDFDFLGGETTSPTSGLDVVPPTQCGLANQRVLPEHAEIEVETSPEPMATRPESIPTISTSGWDDAETSLKIACSNVDGEAASDAALDEGVLHGVHTSESNCREESMRDLPPTPSDDEAAETGSPTTLGGGMLPDAEMGSPTAPEERVASAAPTLEKSDNQIKCRTPSHATDGTPAPGIHGATPVLGLYGPVYGGFISPDPTASAAPVSSGAASSTANNIGYGPSPQDSSRVCPDGQTHLRPDGRPREPPRKKRGRPRDSKPLYTFRVDRQVADQAAHMYQFPTATPGRLKGTRMDIRAPPTNGVGLSNSVENSQEDSPPEVLPPQLSDTQPMKGKPGWAQNLITGGLVPSMLVDQPRPRPLQPSPFPPPNYGSPTPLSALSPSPSTPTPVVRPGPSAALSLPLHSSPSPQLAAAMAHPPPAVPSTSVPSPRYYVGGGRYAPPPQFMAEPPIAALAPVPSSMPTLTTTPAFNLASSVTSTRTPTPPPAAPPARTPTPTHQLTKEPPAALLAPVSSFGSAPGPAREQVPLATLSFKTVAPIDAATPIFPSTPAPLTSPGPIATAAPASPYTHAAPTHRSTASWLSPMP